MTQPSPLQLAQAAYSAYGGYTGRLTYNGRPMPAWKDLGPTVQGAWIAAAGAVERDLHTIFREESTVTLPPYDPARPVPQGAGVVAASQTRHPWRATARTVLAAIPLVPVIVAELGVDSVPWVASGLAVLAAATRVLALPAVDQWLTDHLGGMLAAEPRQP